MTIEQIQDELLAAVDAAQHLCMVHGITTVQPVHHDPQCPCTIEYKSPEDVKLSVSFSCPRHGDGARVLRATIEEKR